ncbi:Alkaline phosphatase 1 [Carabus blaptoides fortunei]
MMVLTSRLLDEDDMRREILDSDRYHARDIYEHHIERRDVSGSPNNAAENTAAYWNNVAKVTLKAQLNKKMIENRAKNVILFLGDGMSIPTLTATRLYQTQKLGRTSGEESRLSFEEFPFIGLSKTYCVDRQVADSACSATAYLCGVKANEGTIGVTAEVARDECTSMNNQSNHVDSVARWSQLAGKATGIVTTTRITHASPSGAYAHTAERDWESDADVEKAGMNATECLDIATQLIFGETGRNFNVILGGGRRKFIPKDQNDEENKKGDRSDGINLIEEWQKLKAANNVRAEYVWHKKQLLCLNPETEYVLGLFENDHLQYNLDADPETEPTLTELTEAAIEVLSKNPKGYFLFVEGGRIDHAHHDTKAQKALDETVQFSDAIRRAREITNLEDTLIIVTSDHAHTMSLSGYPERGNNILGIGGQARDKLPYSTLSYANGPGFHKPDVDGSRHNISNDNMGDKNYEFPSLAPLNSETHGGDDVGIFASGPWAHLLVGVLEQNVIAHVIAYASCVGSGMTACDS